MTIQYDGVFDIATGRSRKEVRWRNKEIQWGEFLKRISQTHRTAEKFSEFISAKKTRQDEIKDVGGFVGGYIIEGRRKPGNILHRQLITLDIDFANENIWQDFTLLYDNASAVYSTHKHTAEHPRLRLVMPLDRAVTADEYVAIARAIAGDVDINVFDDTTFETARLMYWPSTSQDAEFVFEYQDGPWLCADAILAKYKNWRDSSEWPVSDRAKEVLHRDMKKAGDPLEKPGIVGAFCREYDIHQAIEKFLPDVYEACDIDDRYTYKEGTTAAGLVIYNKGTWAYSHHGTDPASGKLCNAFDLVRIQLYGLKDEDAKQGTPINHMPSYLEMVEFASKDPGIRRRITEERIDSIREEFQEDLPPDEAADNKWMEELEVDKKGNIKITIDNIVLVLSNDRSLKGKLALNLFERREVAKDNLPWRKVKKNTRYLTDKDDANIRRYLEKKYNLTGMQKVKDALDIVVEDNAFHPVIQYLKSLEWDGQERVDRLLIDYLGAEDNEYTKAVTRKTIAAAVGRIFNPGCKFDYVLVLVGKQGVGKSTLIRKLGKEWYSDSFASVTGKEAFEAIQSVWILELAELAGLKKAEMEQIKHFISKPEDRYRVAYGKRTENFPRQCIFIGTTNNKDFLRDPTGNRRFWPVDIDETNATKSVFNNLNEAEVSQIWAEAVEIYSQGEDLFLSKEIEDLARDQQNLHAEVDDRAGMIQKYLDTLLPETWQDMDLQQRRNYYIDPALAATGYLTRERVCVAEIWCELFIKPLAEMSRHNTKDIHNIMKNMAGWEESKCPVLVKGYGRQRVYRRYTRPETLYTNVVYHDESLYTKQGIQSIQAF